MKIGLCGTMSVGKTTLVNELKDLPEFKDYTFRTERSKYLRDMGIPLNTDSTLKGQIVFAAERAAELMQENIITDRTVIDVMAFSRLSKSMETYEKDNLNNMLFHLIKDYDIIFYVSPNGVEIEDNGVRTTDVHYRNAVDVKIKSIISTHKPSIKKLVNLEGSTEERLEQIKDTLASL
jgi:nicotinamide riboside kinase